MVNQLKADFYKIIHSKILLTVVLAWFASSFLCPIVAIVHGDFDPVLRNVARDFFIQPMPFLVFACMFCTRDLSTGFVKNTTSVKKHHYLLSKVICLSALVLLFYAFAFALYTLIGFIYSYGSLGSDFFARGILIQGKYPDQVTAKRFLCGEAVYLTNMFAMGMIVLAVSCICRKEILVAIIILPYWLLYAYFWFDVESLFAGQFLSILHGLSAFAQINYMSIWLSRWDGHNGVYGFDWFDYSVARMLLVNVVWSVVSLGVSWLTLTKKEV